MTTNAVSALCALSPERAQELVDTVARLGHRFNGLEARLAHVVSGFETRLEKIERGRPAPAPTSQAIPIIPAEPPSVCPECRQRGGKHLFCRRDPHA